MCGSLQDSHWFDPNNQEAQAKREECNTAVHDDMMEFMNNNTHGVAILDSTNPTHERRKKLVHKMRATKAKVMFIEVTNDNEEFLLNQIKLTADSSPDYASLENAEAQQEYRKKLEFFQGYFQPLNSGEYAYLESKWSYLKADHNNRHFEVHNIKGYLQQKITNFIMNLRTDSHTFYMSRHGQSEYNDLGRIGGDSGLTMHGSNYARELAKYVDTEIQQSINSEGEPTPTLERAARLWTSTMRRTKETAQFIRHNKLMLTDEDDSFDDAHIVQYEYFNMKKREWFHLDELFAGSCDGMTYEEIEQQFPEEWELRKHDKLAYRYPRGESYLDVIARLEPIIIEMERHQEPLLIVAHQGILRIIYAFYMGYSRAEAPYLSIPLNTVIKLEPGAWTCLEKREVLYNPISALKCDGQNEPQMSDPPSH